MSNKTDAQLENQIAERREKLARALYSVVYGTEYDETVDSDIQDNYLLDAEVVLQVLPHLYNREELDFVERKQVGTVKPYVLVLRDYASDEHSAADIAAFLSHGDFGVDNPRKQMLWVDGMLAGWVVEP